jgi:hypothetical protein
VRLAEARLTIEAMGDLALQVQSCGNLALSTKLSRAVTEGAIAVELDDGEREAILEALVDCPPHLVRVRDRLASSLERVEQELTPPH